MLVNFGTITEREGMGFGSGAGLSSDSGSPVPWLIHRWIGSALHNGWPLARAQ